MPFWFLILFGIERLLAIWAIAHAVLYKRDTRAATGWVGLIAFAPLVGPLLFVGFGVNRLRRRGGELQRKLEEAFDSDEIEIPPQARQQLEQARLQYPRFAQMADLVLGLTDRPLLPGNRIRPLLGGDSAYPDMLQSIRNAETSIALQTYIFDNDRAGREFIEALEVANQRGVNVRVVVDDVGSRYTKPTAVKQLQRRGIACGTFLPTRLPALAQYANLRNHRKIMVVDGRVAYTGGMNIREGCRLDWETRHPVQDIHFRLEGPVVTHLQEAFIADWAFVSDEVLRGSAWLPTPEMVGDAWARGIPDGPDEDFEKLLMTLLGAINTAQHRLIIVTPYFLPDASLIHALGVASLRGVQVDIILPEQNNQRIVQWACAAMIWQVLMRDCRVHLSSPPFDHTKLLLIDDAYVLFGSTNWDPRSLRLNFEYNVECYNTSLCEQLTAVVDQKIEAGRPLTIDEINDRSLPVQLRDGVARLFTPYI